MKKLLRDVGVVVLGLIAYAAIKHLLYSLYLGTFIQAVGFGM